MSQQNSGGRFRQKKHDFTMVSNSPLRDESISLRARGLYATIQYYIEIPNFTLYKSYLERNCTDGQKSFNKAWDELKERGYLKQYRLKDPVTQRFYWEYELLDTPKQDVKEESPKPEPEQQHEHKKENEPYPQKVAMPKAGVAKAVHGEGEHINNTSLNHTLPNNTVSNHINQASQQQFVTIEDVKEQIEYEDILVIRNDNPVQELEEICLVIQEVMNTDVNDKIRVQKRNLSAYYVQERFRMLRMEHIDYVLDRLEEGVSRVRNPKAFLITALYNAPMTMHVDIVNRVAYDFMFNKGV
jgi:hypothetical protein